MIEKFRQRSQSHTKMVGASRNDSIMAPKQVLAGKNTVNSNAFWTRGSIPNDWEYAPMNDRQFYKDSPVAKFVKSRGDFSEDKHLSRTFNRRLRMRDTFTSIIPMYTHVPRTCYMPTVTHTVFPEFKKDITGKPFAKAPRPYNHRMDQIKVYNEEMLKLREFAPQPIKRAPKQGLV